MNAGSTQRENDLIDEAINALVRAKEICEEFEIEITWDGAIEELTAEMLRRNKLYML